MIRDFRCKIGAKSESGKIENMGTFLNDERLLQMAMDETEGDMPIDNKTTVENIKNIFTDLMNSNET